jgi:hypothetical protein
MAAACWKSYYSGVRVLLNSDELRKSVVERLRDDNRLHVYSFGPNRFSSDREEWPFYIGVDKTIEKRRLNDDDKLYVSQVLDELDKVPSPTEADRAASEVSAIRLDVINDLVSRCVRSEIRSEFSLLRGWLEGTLSVVQAGYQEALIDHSQRLLGEIETIRQDEIAKASGDVKQAAEVLADDATKRNAHVELENGQLRDQLAELRKTHYKLIEENKRLLQTIENEPFELLGGEKEPEVSALDLRSLLEAVARQYSDCLAVWPDAFDGARKAPAGVRLDQCASALKALADFARLYFSDPTSIGPPDTWFEAFGLHYAGHESEPTMNKYGAQRQFRRPDGLRQEIQRHITLDRNNNHACISIYFEVDGESRKISIAYCGPHLRNAQRPS